MGFEVGIPELVLVLVVAALIFGAGRRKASDDDLFRSHLHKEFGRMPVYSAETTSGKEAEFIRDRLPKRFPIVIVLGVVVIFGAVAWWLTR
jgi:hypothetical protein